jgi:ATP-dependent DNA helicase RecG
VPISLTTPLGDVPAIAAVEPGLAQALAELELTNVGRLIAHVPIRHEKLEAEALIKDLQPGQLISVRGEVTATRVAGVRQYHRSVKGRFEAVLMDHTGRLDLVWFNQPYLRQTIMPGVRLRVQGKVNKRGPGLQLANPQYEILTEEAEPTLRDETFRPVYPASENANSLAIQRAIEAVLDDALPLIEDHLPGDFRDERALPHLREAYRMMHAPADQDEFARARRRLAYDELLLLQLGLQMKRRHLRTSLTAPALRHSDAIDKHIRKRLPFTLTHAQDKVVAEIARDLSSTVPTNRLIQGDVGSGKTVVAVYAMLMAVASEHQAALMAPTELLAEQHFLSISSLLKGTKVTVELLTGTTPKAQQSQLLERVRSGDLDILVGTHALITDRVRFHSLAVAIIDEQHRFGVGQRATFRVKSAEESAPGGASGKLGKPRTPHVLVMTATPIPRTIAISLLGDLDVSTIDALPPGRTPITTRLVGPEKRDDVYAWLGERVEAGEEVGGKGGEQAYVVVPAIDTGNENLRDLRAVAARLKERELAGRRIASMHGRLKRETRASIMERFRTGTIDVLVATTVIEVGVDVPNASIMVIEHAERFGLAQLHQLRGRVGRGERPSVCVLIGEATTPDGQARLDAISSTTDGFALAERDIEIRGPGEVFGTRQSGGAPMKVADFGRDLDLLRMALKDAKDWIERSPTLCEPHETVLRRRLLKAHGEHLGLGDVG